MIHVTIEFDTKNGHVAIRQDLYVSAGFDPTAAQIGDATGRAMRRAGQALIDAQKANEDV